MNKARNPMRKGDENLSMEQSDVVRELRQELEAGYPDSVKILDILNDIRSREQKKRTAEERKKAEKAKREKKEIKNVVSEHFRQIEEEFKERADEFFSISEEKRQKKAFIISLHLVLNGLKTNQIRRFLSVLQEIRAKQRKGASADELNASILRIRPVLIYAARNKQVEPLLRIVDRILPFLNDKNFEDFYYFVQAIVAYHKFLGGGD